MSTGHCAWAAQAALTEPSRIPVSSPCPRLPTTSSAASREAATRSLDRHDAATVPQFGVADPRVDVVDEDAFLAPGEVDVGVCGGDGIGEYR